MSLDSSLISYIIRYNDLVGVQRQGVTQDDFVDEFRSVFRYLLKVKKEHDTLPSKSTLLARFPDLDLPRVRETEMPMLIGQVRQRRKFTTFLGLIHQAADQLTDYERADEAVQWLQGQLNGMAFSSGQKNHMVDLFSREASREIRKELRLRRSEEGTGIKTGLRRLDEVTGGLHKQQMCTIIARTGVGKSWLNLLFVKSAVMQGKKVILYPLEMSLFETAARLYTLFSSDMLGQAKVIKNFDIVSGKVDRKKILRFMNSLEDRFPGQLYVADVGRLMDPYTNERIEAEVEAYAPDLFWVDYLTLLKVPQGGAKGENEASGIRRLSNGIKMTATRRNVVGGCSAQVNREGIRAGAGLIPRLEHIAFGDSIGHDSDLVMAAAKDKGKIYYGLIKNRSGPEIEKTRLRTEFNRGVIAEDESGDEG